MTGWHRLLDELQRAGAPDPADPAYLDHLAPDDPVVVVPGRQVWHDEPPPGAVGPLHGVVSAFSEVEVVVHHQVDGDMTMNSPPRPVGPVEVRLVHHSGQIDTFYADTVVITHATHPVKADQ